MCFMKRVIPSGRWRLLAIVMCGLLAGGALAQSDVYRSRDASGRAVFSDRPAPGESRPVTAPSTPPPASSPGGRGTDWQAAEQSFRQRSAARAETAQREAKERQQMETRLLGLESFSIGGTRTPIERYPLRGLFDGLSGFEGLDS